MLKYNVQLNHCFKFCNSDSIVNITRLGKSYSCFSTTTQLGNLSIESLIQLELRNLSKPTIGLICDRNVQLNNNLHFHPIHSAATIS